MLVWAALEPAIVEERARHPGAEIRERTASCLPFLALASLVFSLWVGGIQCEIPLAGDTAAPLPGSSLVESITRQSVFARIEHVVVVRMGFFRARDCWRARSPARRRDSRPYGAMTFLAYARGSALPPVGRRYPRRDSVRGRYRGPPARYIPLQRFASTGPEMHSGQRLHTTKRLPLAPNS